MKAKVLSELNVGDCFRIDIRHESCMCIIIQDMGEEFLCDISKGEKQSFSKYCVVYPISQQEFITVEETIELPVVTIKELFVFKAMIGDEERQFILKPIDLMFRPEDGARCTMVCKVIEGDLK